MSIYLAAGEAVFAHQCADRRQSRTVGWGIGYPALDERSIPACSDCGRLFDRVPACQGARTHAYDEHGEVAEPGDHDCHPISGHITRSDDHTQGLGPEPEPDPMQVKAQRRAFVQWVIAQRQVIAQTGALLEADDFASEWHREDCRLTHELARLQLQERGIGSEVILRRPD